MICELKHCNALFDKLKAGEAVTYQLVRVSLQHHQKGQFDQSSILNLLFVFTHLGRN